jgi:FkbM family methyltransferase
MGFYGDRGVDSVLRIFYPTQKGVMIEVGAASPYYISLSKHFRGIGWNILSIEPNPKFAEQHRILGHKVVECACGVEDKDDIEFEVASEKVSSGRGTSESFSSIRIKEELKQYFPKQYSEVDIEKIKVNMRRLDTILKEHAITDIDILTVDTEGWELEVINGLDLGNHSPKLMLIENYSKDSKYNDMITSYGYELVCQLYPNYLYIKRGMFSEIQIIAAKLYVNVLKIKGVSWLITQGNC